jgi:hypothetical protein
MNMEEHVKQFGHYMQLSERCRASINAAVYFVSTCNDIAELEPEVALEIAAAVDRAREAIEAVGRAETFARTRLEVGLEG